METRSIVGRINPAIAAVAVIIIVLLATGFVLSDRFRTVSNLQNILEQSAPLAFVALGQTLVILAGGIDLSLDGQIALISTLASGLIDGQPDRVLPVVAGALLLGAAIGLANGARGRRTRAP